jgi:Ala-tRNA(Pro) deacylase
MSHHPLTQKISELLTARGMWFETFEHEPVRTSEEAARVRSEYALAQGAKALIVRARKNGKKFFVQIVVPGDRKFDTKKLKAVFGLSDVRFATEDEVFHITDGVLPGGVPPFGNLFGLAVYMDQTLVKQEKIIFNAGDRSFSIGMFLRDYLEVVKPHVGDIDATY